MEAAELMKRLIEFGIDEEGVKDRFCENDELYMDCIINFFSEPYFESLKNAIRYKQCRKAFEAVHALKGLSGNLGLTELYKICCDFTEALRVDDMTHADEQCYSLMNVYDKLKVAAFGTQ